MSETVNTNVLVIDDEEMIRNNIEEILMPVISSDTANVNKAADILFGGTIPIVTSRRSSMPAFKVKKASSGMEGLEMVRSALAEDNPYAVIFLDMRMPVWDGLETAARIREFDSKAEIIFVTAFSDRSIEDIISIAGQNVGYHCKPYASEEIVQMATKAVSDYNKLRNLEKLIDVISSINLDEQQLTLLLKNILDQLATYVETDIAIMGKLHDDDTYEKMFAIGAVEEKINIQELIQRIKSIPIPQGAVMQIDEVVFAKVESYTVFAALKKNEKLITEKLYLLKLFIQSSAKAIQNVHLQEQLLQREKLSAIGSAMGMVMHDLRSPINNIPLLTALLREGGIESQWIDMIDQSAAQASEIFDDFLDFLRDATVYKERINVAELVSTTMKLMDVKPALAQLNLTKNIPLDIFIQGDESKLQRSIINILNNATDALAYYHTENPSISISASAEENTIVIIIKDNGPGIPISIMKNLFEPFVTKDKSVGTGLGLAIVKQYILAHGGSIIAENNNGAVFTITLPKT
ncbi:MAG: ATP-binding protein [Bacteroidota bacterium]